MEFTLHNRAMLVLRIAILAGLATSDLPHPKCSYNTKIFLKCDSASVEISITFDVNLIPLDLKSLSVDCPKSKTRNYCNVLHTVHSVAHALPFRSSLAQIWLGGFKNADGKQFSAGGLLRNNKHITELGIAHSRIYYIDRNFLVGFHSLVALYLPENDIDDIRIDAFEDLIPPSGGSVLREIFLSGNRLEHLNWNILRPVANSLVELDLSSQQPKLHSIHYSGTRVELKLAALYLENNGLEFIPVIVLDSLGHPNSSTTGPRKYYFHDNAFCSSSDQAECACCDVADFMRWVKNFTSVTPYDVPPEIKFSCGPEAIHYINNEEGIALADSFRHCSSLPEASPRQTTLPKTTNSPQTAAIMQSSTSYVEPACAEPKPVEINCNGSHLTLSDSDLLQAEGTTVVFSSDGSFLCSRKLYELHMLAMDLFDKVSTNATEGQFETIDVICHQGRAEMNSIDPERSRAKKLVFRSDLSTGCYSKFTRFLEYIDGNLIENSRPQNIAIDSAFALDDWLRTKRKCARISVVTANCTGGMFTFSWANISTISASGIALRSDETLECRHKLATIHDHILSQKTTMVLRPNPPVSDAVVAVCRKGSVYISEDYPRRSTKKMLEYYYVVTKSCQETFQKFLGFLLTLT